MKIMMKISLRIAVMRMNFQIWLTKSLFRFLFVRKMMMMTSWKSLLDLNRQSDLSRKCSSQKLKKLSEKKRKQLFKKLQICFLNMLWQWKKLISKMKLSIKFSYQTLIWKLYNIQNTKSNERKLFKLNSTILKCLKSER